MRNLRLLDIYRDSSKRVLDIFGFAGDETCGIFRVRSKVDQAELLCQASSDDGWDHVSVSRGDRCPTWDEMEQVKRLFFRGSETAMQLHVPVAEHISFCGTCLHLWRPQHIPIPRPPKWMVGPTNDIARNAMTGKPGEQAMSNWTQYRRSKIAEMRPYEVGEDLDRVSIGAEDQAAGSPKVGDMIARNPRNHADQWLVAAEYFAENFAPLEGLSDADA